MSRQKIIILISSWILVLVAFLLNRSFDPDEIDVKYIIENNLAEEIEAQEAAIDELINKFSSISQPYNIQLDYDYPIRVYDNGDLIYWNTNDYLPPYSEFRGNDTLYYYDGTSSYLIERETIKYHETGLLEFYGFIPIYERFAINNEYLNTGINKDIFDRFEITIFEGGIPIMYGEKELFRFELRYMGPGYLTILLEFLFLLAIIITVYFFYTWLLTQASLRATFAFLFFLTVARLVLLKLGFSLGSTTFLFDPKVYTSHWWLPSLGDLTLNLIILFLFSRLCFNFLLKNKDFNAVVLHHKWIKHLWLIVILGVSLTSATFLFDLTWNLLENSQIDLDISSTVNFDFIRVYSFALILFMGVIFFHFNHVAFQYFVRVADTVIVRLVYVILISALYLLLANKFGWIVLVVFAFMWLILFLSELTFQLSNVRYLTFYYYLLVAISVSILCSMAIYKHYERDEVIKKKRFASGLLLENDILAEFYLNEVLEEIKRDPNIRSRFYTQFLARQNLKDRILQLMPSYLNKYDIQVHVFDPNGIEFVNSEAISLSYWQESFQKDQYETSYDNIYFIPSKGGGRDKYLAFLKLEQFGQLMGHIVLELTVKKYIPSTVFPALLVEESPQKTTEEFDYGIYSDGKLVLSQGSFTFEDNVPVTFLEKAKERRQGMEDGDHHLYAMEISNDRVLLIVSELYKVSRIIANISFFFVQSLAVIGLIYIILRFTHQIYSSSLANRIQLYIGLSFLIPTLFISIAILNTLNSSYREEIDRSYQQTARNLAENLVTDIDLFINNLINRDQFTVDLMQAAGLVQTDLIIYDVNGQLLGTSRPEVFRNNLLSDRINPTALRFIKNQLGTAQVIEERIGELRFKTTYTGIYDYQEGALLAILALPYFDAKNNLNNQQVEVFSNLITFFSLVFLITIVLGNIGIQNLVVPIKSIAERLGKTNLMEGHTQPLEYHTSDEIGMLVSEYNLMLETLEQSKQRLAQIQKETAWKEIARQVAHEIKNPLTPMRLKVQQLQRDLESGSKEYKMLSSLLTQIDSLSSIADSFSAFAKLPAPQNITFNLSDLVDDIVQLYSGNEYVLSTEIESSLHVYADPKLLSQILNNLILNAIQSLDKDNNFIQVKLENSNGKALVMVKDTGSGIPEEIHHKIFTPYFSTKEKGSGIGLALARKGIEQANGTIWFETKEDIGTAFYFTLPLV